MPGNIFGGACELFNNQDGAEKYSDRALRVEGFAGFGGVQGLGFRV